jgi:hypothetical protein
MQIWPAPSIFVATHNVMGPVATIASANCAAAMQDFLGHETFDFRMEIALARAI